tara:strand:+ start:97 stop:516 length:420 start_codon:yes stop_codon:yes gene_type:complete
MLVTSIPQYVQGLLNVKVDLTTTDKKTIYTAPSNADFNASVIHSILVMNKSSSASTLSVTFTGDGVDGGSGAVTNQEFFYTTNFNVSALGQTEFLPNTSRDLILNAGEVIKVQAGHADRIQIILSIQEYAVVRTPQVDL